MNDGSLEPEDGLFELAARLSSPWVPPITALIVFGCGAALLVAGSLPAGHHTGSLAALELSHFSASLVGISLVLVAHGLWRRLDAAHGVSLALLGIGALGLVGRGAYGWAAALFAIALALAPLRRGFYRQGSLFAEPLGKGAWLSVALVLAAAATLAWLGLHGRVLKTELWWRFALDADAPRFLRAFVAALALAVAFGFSQLLRPASPRVLPATSAELARAVPVLAQASKASAHLALLGDKAVLFGEGDRALVAYGVEGRAFVALGDPVGPEKDATELAWAFKALADRHRGFCCFYEVTHHHLPRYLDLGLTLRKVGEEAVVPLERFSLEGPERAPLRQSVRKVEKEQVSFEVVGPERVPPLLDALEAISNDWLSRKGRAEKSFSIGYFDRAYLARTPLALVRQGERPVAFANLWACASRAELEIDLMRQTADAPRAVMDYLFVQLMLWAKREGYARFSLGGAPFSGLSNRSLAPAWHRLGAFVFRHGEAFYGFRGVRQFKEKFRPEWEPRYLAAPGGLALPRVLAAIAALGSAPPKGPR